MSRLRADRAGAHIRVWHIEVDHRARNEAEARDRGSRRRLISPSLKNGPHGTWPVPIRLTGRFGKTGPDAVRFRSE